MDTAIATLPAPVPQGIIRWTDEELDLIKHTVAPGLNDAELKLLAYQANRTGLDVLARQIYGLKYSDRMAIIVGIDGFRLIGSRSGRYLPGRENTYTYGPDKQFPLTATAYGKVWSDHGESWHEVSVTAHWREYAKVNGQGKPYGNWASMPHVMLGKVAEALLIRKCCPDQLSGLYSQEEMDQAENPRQSSEREESKQEHRQEESEPPATAAQVTAMYVIARNEQQQDEAELDAACTEIYGVPVAKLSRRQASEAIDRMKAGSWPNVTVAKQPAGTTGQPKQERQSQEFATPQQIEAIADAFLDVDVQRSEIPAYLKLWVGPGCNRKTLRFTEAETLLAKLEVASLVYGQVGRADKIDPALASFLQRDNASIQNITEEEMEEIVSLLEATATTDSLDAQFRETVADSAL